MGSCDNDVAPDVRKRALHEQMRWVDGVVPRNLAGVLHDDGNLVLAENAFLFLTPGGNRFHYRLGNGLVVQRAGSLQANDDFEIFLWGTVFGAVAWMNGYFALHASAAAFGDGLVAFTADSGGGKSTLAAALSRLGRPHVCDDTLALARSSAGIVGVPDGKPLKLWSDAVDYLDAETTGHVEAVPGKFFAKPASIGERALPLRDLVLLERGESEKLTRVTRKSEALIALASALYRPGIAAALGNRTGHANWMMDIVREVRIWRLTRPFTRLSNDQFAAIDRIIGEITARDIS